MRTEWYQSLAAGPVWFASARIGYRRDDATVYDDDTLRPAAIVRTCSGIVPLSLGRRLLYGGQVRVGTQYRRLSLAVAIPDTAEDFRFTEDSWFGDFRFDTLDSFGLPTRGHLLSAAAQYVGRAQLIST